MSSSGQAATLPPCDSCGGAQVGNFHVVGKSGVGVHPAGKSWWKPMAGLDATVCVECGQVRLAVRNLEKFRQETQKNPEAFRW